MLLAIGKEFCTTRVAVNFVNLKPLRTMAEMRTHKKHSGFQFPITKIGGNTPLTKPTPLAACAPTSVDPKQKNSAHKKGIREGTPRNVPVACPVTPQQLRRKSC